jgi:hypothetical protein
MITSLEQSMTFNGLVSLSGTEMIKSQRLSKLLHFKKSMVLDQSADGLATHKSMSLSDGASDWVCCFKTEKADLTILRAKTNDSW